MTLYRDPAMTRTAAEPIAARMLRIGIGAFLLVLVLVPIHRLLDAPASGMAGRYTRALMDIYYEFAGWGLLLVLPVGILAARFISMEGDRKARAVLSNGLLRGGTVHFVLACALGGASITALFSLTVLGGKPSYIDAFPQLLQARYWAAGMVAGPADGTAPFWAIQNSLFTERGWVSQYPPGHVATLTPFLWLGLPWLHGPVMVFVTIAFTGLLAHRLLGHDRVSARTGTLLLALCPFLLFLGSSYMNHVTTAACLSVGCYALVRGWGGETGWAIPAGLAFALALATRPLSTLAVATSLVMGLLLLFPVARERVLRVLALAALTSLPVVAAWLAYNQHFFGSPFRLGYSATLGPEAGLGFGTDPWGNEYGPLEAVAYTSADLIGLGVSLFETPVSSVVVIGVFLVLVRLSRPIWLLMALALAPLLANSLYWHHSMYMGPRMLHEVSPLWVLLFGTALIGLMRFIPEESRLAGRYFLRPGIAAMLATSLLMGAFYLAPRRGMSYGGHYLGIARTPVPQAGPNSLVFVHDAWTARIGMSLAAAGFRLDETETLLRQNPTCLVHQLSQAVLSGDSAGTNRLLRRMDLIASAERTLPAVEISAGNRIRLLDRASFTQECTRQAASDRLGILDIAPLLWQTELHGSAGYGALIVRDMGPEHNRRILRAYPDREAFVYFTDGDRPILTSYAAGMWKLWQDRNAAPQTDAISP